jgi:hypothetical protein
MALLTVSELREHVDTDLGDTALARLLADADAEIVRRYGAHVADIVEVFTPPPGSTTIHLSRDLSAVDSIVEVRDDGIGEATLTLDTDDYSLLRPRTIRRLTGGSYSATSWAPIVTVTYAPVADDARRTLVTVDLVKLAVQYQAASSVTVGDVSISHADYARERENLLRRLAPSIMGVWA